MPLVKHNSKKGRLAVSAENKNNRLISVIMKDSESTPIFARIEANLGPCFRMVFYDREARTCKQIMGEPRGLFRQRKARIRFATGDLVILSEIPTGSVKMTEIIGHVQPEEAQELYESGRIHKDIYNSSKDDSATEQDQLFDFSSENIDAI